MVYTESKILYNRTILWAIIANMMLWKYTTIVEKIHIFPNCFITILSCHLKFVFISKQILKYLKEHFVYTAGLGAQFWFVAYICLYLYIYIFFSPWSIYTFFWLWPISNSCLHLPYLHVSCCHFTASEGCQVFATHFLAGFPSKFAFQGLNITLLGSLQHVDMKSNPNSVKVAQFCGKTTDLATLPPLHVLLLRILRH